MLRIAEKKENLPSLLPPRLFCLMIAYLREPNLILFSLSCKDWWIKISCNYDPDIWKKMPSYIESSVPKLLTPAVYYRQLFNNGFAKAKNQMQAIFSSNLSPDSCRETLTKNFNTALKANDFIIAFQRNHISSIMIGYFSENYLSGLALKYAFQGCALKLLDEKKMTSDHLTQLCVRDHYKERHEEKVKHLFATADLVVKVLATEGGVETFRRMACEDALKITPESFGADKLYQCLIM